MRLFVLALLSFSLIGCPSSVQELRQSQPAKTVTVSGTASAFSSCVQYHIMAADDLYRYQLLNDGTHPVLLATRTSDFITQQQMAGIEMRFVEQGPKTTIEIREGNIDGSWLAKRALPIIESCASAPDADARPPRDAATATRPIAP